MTRLPAFLNIKEWPINLYVLKNIHLPENNIYIYLPHLLRTKYFIELNAVFKIMDISGLTLPSSDISSKVHRCWDTYRDVCQHTQRSELFQSTPLRCNFIFGWN